MERGPLRKTDSPVLHRQLAGEDVLRAEELRDVRRLRPPEHIGRLSALQYTAAVEQDRDVAQRSGLREIVRHVQRRESPLAMNRADLAARGGPPLRIERRERLVEQQQPWAARQRPRERDELAFAATERAHGSRVELVDAEPPRDGVRDRRVGRAVRHVLFDGKVRKEEARAGTRARCRVRRPAPWSRRARRARAGRRSAERARR